MQYVSKLLTFVAFLSVLNVVTFHTRPIVSYSKSFGHLRLSSCVTLIQYMTQSKDPTSVKNILALYYSLLCKLIIVLKIFIF